MDKLFERFLGLEWSAQLSITTLLITLLFLFRGQVSRYLPMLMKIASGRAKWEDFRVDDDFPKMDEGSWYRFHVHPLARTPENMYQKINGIIARHRAEQRALAFDLSPIESVNTPCVDGMIQAFGEALKVNNIWIKIIFPKDIHLQEKTQLSRLYAFLRKEIEERNTSTIAILEDSKGARTRLVYNICPVHRPTGDTDTDIDNAECVNNGQKNKTL